MGDTFCSLCGVPFGVSSDVYDDRMSEDELSWTEEFCALRRANGFQNPTDHINGTEESPIWRLTATGRGIPPSGVFKPPPFSARQSDSEDGCKEKDTLEDEPVVAFKTREGLPNHEVAYPMHPICLELLKQQYAQHARGTSLDIDILGKILSSQPLDENERGLKPDWSNDGYLGAEQFWRDGWDWMEEPLLENEFSDIEDYDYLVLDPGKVEGFDMLLQNPPTYSTSQGADAIMLAVLTPVTDCFLGLPQELLSVILCYLPASDVKSARLASRTMANVPLSDTYWHSRFDFPFELSHFDWDPSWISGRTEVAHINWPAFCLELLHPDEDESEFGWWRNRKRISSLMKGLALHILGEQGQTMDEKRHTREDGTVPNVVCRQELSIASSSKTHSTDINFGLEFPLAEIRKISIAFKHTQDKELVCGISFYETSRVVTVGQCNTKNIQTAVLEHGCTFAGFMFAMNRRGIIGIQVLVSNGQGVIALETTLGLFTDESDPFAFGKLAAVDDSEIYGLRIAMSKHNTIVSVGLLELINPPEELVSEQAALRHSDTLWQPSVPPGHLFITAPSGAKECYDFQYSQHIIFAEKADNVKSLSRVTTFCDLSPPGLTGIQFHFDDAASTPPEAPFRGKCVDFFVDGPGGEMICGVDVFWGDEEQCLGISFLTNKGRRSPFNQTLINSDIKVERQVPPAGMLMIGVYMRIIHDGRNIACCNGFGILCARNEVTIPTESLPPPEVSKAPADDHFNTWIGDSQPPTDFIFGEDVGCQPNHGFANWVCFDNSIKKLTACLGSHASNQTSKDSLTGLKFEIENSLPVVLGRHISLGSEFILAGNDRISEVTVTVTVSKTPEIIGIRFRTRDGIDSGEVLFGEQIQRLGDHQKRSVSLKSTASLVLVGLAWSYDLGPIRPAWHGVQPIYRLKDNPRTPQLQLDLYPSMAWSRPPPGYLQMRPIPAMQSNVGAFESSVSEAGIVDRPGDITSITVFFNAFLQGVEFNYHGGHKESVGNLIGQFQKIDLESGEEISSIEIYERVRSIFANAANPREVVCVEGIKFGFTKRQNGEIHTRSAPCCGPDRPFGPFLHRQGGLWQAAGNDSADWFSCYKLQVHSIMLNCGEVFKGLYSETLPTLIRRVGVVVSRTPTDGHDVAQPNPPRPSSVLKAEASNDTNEIPWLGSPPAPSLTLIPPSLNIQGIYRLWCTIPHDLKSYTVYRQLVYTPEPKHFVMGLEFHSLRPGFNTLLGFRSMQSEEALTVSLDDEAVGLASRGTYGLGEFQGLESVELLTLATAREREEALIVTAPKRLHGVYAIFGERIHAIGILQG